MNSQKNIYKTNCGGNIIITEKVKSHLEAHPGIIDLIPEIASRVTLPTDGSRLARQISLGRVIGQSSLINTKKIGFSETAWFAVRKNRMKASRVVPNAAPADTDLVSIVANPIEKKSYELVTAWFGAMAPKEPWDPNLAHDPAAYAESINFWCRYALIHNTEIMDDTFESAWDIILT